MQRRKFVQGVVTAGVLGLAGCLGDDETDDGERVGEGRLRLRNQSGGSISLEYGLLDEDTTIEEADLRTQVLTLDGDEFEIVYTDRTGGPYRVVVTAPDRDWQPVEHRWILEDCTDLTVEVTALPDQLNVSLLSCVANPSR